MFGNTTLFATPAKSSPEESAPSALSTTVFHTPSATPMFGGLKSPSGSLFGGNGATDAAKSTFNPSSLTFGFGSSSNTTAKPTGFQFGR